jgi:hypothetical protein
VKEAVVSASPPEPAMITPPPRTETVGVYHADVMEFLNDCNMEQHYDNFIKNGIDDLEIINELSEEHLA